MKFLSFFSRDFVTAEVLACKKSFSFRVACLTLNYVSICVVFDDQLTWKDYFVFSCCHKPLRYKLPDRCLTKQFARGIAYAYSNLFWKLVNAILNLFLCFSQIASSVWRARGFNFTTGRREKRYRTFKSRGAGVIYSSEETFCFGRLFRKEAMLKRVWPSINEVKVKP